MCNLYGTTDRLTLRSQLFARIPEGTPDWPSVIGPLGSGVFVGQEGIARVGQWGLIPPDSPTRKPVSKATGRPLSTNNARRETVASAWTFRGAWQAGQRCLIPAWWFQEPYWGIRPSVMLTPAPKSTSWHFRRADALPWMLAGLWSQWVEPGTGECVYSYTMLTQNCDGHPVLELMHKPDPKLPSRPTGQTHGGAYLGAGPRCVASWQLASGQRTDSVPAPDTLHHGPADPERAAFRSLPL